MNFLVSCLTATHGRWSWVREAITCFVEQDYDNKELIILNNHPTPLICELPQVKVYNEPYYPTLGDCRNRLLKLASGEFVRTWDDDDLYLPWAISQGVKMIEDAPAWKPKRSWFSKGNEVHELGENVYEASITFRTEFARKHGYQSSGGDEHNPIMFALQKENCKIDEMGIWASYIYRWDTPLWRISGSLGSDTIENRTRAWKEKNNEHGNGKLLTPASLSSYWRNLNLAIKEEFNEENPILSGYDEADRLSS